MGDVIDEVAVLSDSVNKARSVCREAESRLKLAEQRLSAAMKRHNPTLESLADECRRRWGVCTLECFGDQWRVWLQNGWHEHNEFGTRSGEPSGHGATALQALVNLFARNERSAFVRGRDCAACRALECDL